jgi:hypothetical protein
MSPDQWLDPTKLTVASLLLAGLYAYHRITRYYFDLFQAKAAAELSASKEDCKYFKDMTQSLIAKLDSLADANREQAEAARAAVKRKA